jgi:hypothetical protein
MGFEPLQFSLETWASNSQASNQVGKALTFYGAFIGEGGTSIVASFQPGHRNLDGVSRKGEGLLLSGVNNDTQGRML